MVLKDGVDVRGYDFGCQCTEVLEERFTYERSFLCADTRVSAEAGPVTPTVDPAEIRGLSTT
jgi:hypothetical protein